MKSQIKKKTDSLLNTNSKKYYEVFIFAILMFELAVLCPNAQHMNDWTITYYFLSYNLGFNSRFFIGSIFKILFEYISASTLYLCIFIIITCMNAFLAVILGGILRKSLEANQYITKCLLILFLSSPVSLSFLFDQNNFGRFDMYLIIISAIMMLLVKKKYARWLIPLLCVLCEMIHQGYIFTYMPIIAIILLYECYKSGFKVINIILCIVTYTLIIFSFIYFQFLVPELNFENAHDLVSSISQRTDLVLNTELVYVEYFYTWDGWIKTIFPIVKPLVFSYGTCMFLATFPLIAVFILLWVNAFKKAQDKFSQFILFLCMSAPVTNLPLLIGNDWDRWIPAIFLVQFSLAFYFLSSGFPCIMISGNKIEKYFREHYFLFVLINIYLSLFTFSETKFLLFYVLSKEGAWISKVLDFTDYLS